MRLPISHETLSAFAMATLQLNGRGAVIVREGEVVALDGEPELGTALDYLWEGSEWFAAFGGWPKEGCAEAVAAYEPEGEFVLLEFGGAGGLVANVIPLGGDEA